MNHTKIIAERTLFDSNGHLNQSAYSAAIQAQFPPGSPYMALEKYVASVKGSCREPTPGDIRCEVTISGTICVADVLSIHATTDGAVIKDIRTDAHYRTC
jgi:hypothetical protein